MRIRGDDLRNRQRNLRGLAERSRLLFLSSATAATAGFSCLGLLPPPLPLFRPAVPSSGVGCSFGISMNCLDNVAVRSSLLLLLYSSLPRTVKNTRRRLRKGRTKKRPPSPSTALFDSPSGAPKYRAAAALAKPGYENSGEYYASNDRKRYEAGSGNTSGLCAIEQSHDTH